MRYLNEGFGFAFCAELLYEQMQLTDVPVDIPWNRLPLKTRLAWMGIVKDTVFRHLYWEQADRRACEVLADYSI
jgi:hypothetical protein